MLKLQTAKRLALRFFHNRNVRAEAVWNSPYAMINDGAHNCKLLTYYIGPLEQIAQLKENFTDIQVFSLATGARIENLNQLKRIEDAWLYYLCQIK